MTAHGSLGFPARGVLGSEERKEYNRLAMISWRTRHREAALGIEKRSRLKNRRVAVVYAWIAPGGAVDYVGRGTVDRSKHHRYSATWCTPRHLLMSMTCDNEWQAMEYEGKWGARLQPRYNIEGYRHAG